MLKKYGSEAVIGFGIIDSLDQLTEERIENARVIDGLFDQNEWGGCNQCYALRDGRIGVIGHQSYFDKRDGVNLSVYLNIVFIFDPDTFKATDPQVIAVRSSYPKTPAKTPELVDCAFTSGIIKRPDGLVSLYSGLSDCAEGYVVIPNPFGDLL